MPFTIESTNVWPITIGDATPSSDGLMSAADKTKLDSLSPGGGGTLAQSYAAATVSTDNVLPYTFDKGGVIVSDDNEEGTEDGYLGVKYGPDQISRFVVYEKYIHSEWSAGDLFDDQGGIRFVSTTARSPAIMMIEGSGDYGEGFGFRLQVVHNIFVDQASLVINSSVAPYGGMQDVMTMFANGTVNVAGALTAASLNASFINVGSDFGLDYVAAKVINPTAATLLTVYQNSPMLQLGGQVYLVDTSVPLDWLMQAQMTTSGGSAAGDLVFYYALDGVVSERVRFSATPGYMLLDGNGINVSGALENDVLAYDGDNFVPTPISALLSGISIASGQYPYRAIADADYACVAGDCYINASSWATSHTLTLPLASSGAGRIIIFANGNNNSTVVNAAGGNTIDGSAEKYPAAFGVWTFVSDGVSDWRVSNVLVSVP